MIIFVCFLLHCPQNIFLRSDMLCISQNELKMDSPSLRAHLIFKGKRYMSSLADTLIFYIFNCFCKISTFSSISSKCPIIVGNEDFMLSFIISFFLISTVLCCSYKGTTMAQLGNFLSFFFFFEFCSFSRFS